MKLKIIRGAAPGQIIPLGNTVFTIGRESDNKLVINENGVSRHHCILSPAGGEWYIEDCQSVNGVLVNGVKITSSQLLKPGDSIVVYSHEMVFLTDDGEVAAGSAAAVSAPVASGFAGPSSGASGPLLIREERGRMPVGKLMILVVILALAGILAYMVFLPEDDMAHVVKVEPASPGESESGVGGALAAGGVSGLAAAVQGDQALADGEPAAAVVSAGGGDEGDGGYSGTRGQAATTEGVPASASEVVLLLSDPPGAQIIMDQEMLSMVTPAILRQVKPGRHTVEFRKEGYENSVRTIHVPDTLPDGPVVLRQLEQTVWLSSEPSGAHVWLDRQFLGVTPVLLTQLPVGRHTVRLDGPGCEPKSVEIEVSAARGEKVAVELSVHLGHLEVVTQPAGCRVYLESSLLGTTVAAGTAGGASQPLRLSDLLAGEQRLKVEHPSGLQKSGKVVIPKGDTLRMQVRLAVPTHRLTLTDGSVLEGMVLEVNPQGDIAWEGLDRRSERFLKPQIGALQELTPEESRLALENQRKGGGGRGDDLLSGKGGPILISELERLMLKLPAEEFNKLYSGKRLTLTGRPIMTMPDPRNPRSVVVMFAKTIKCHFASLSKDELEMMNNGDKAALTLSGICAGIDRDRVLSFGNCTLTSDF